MGSFSMAAGTHTILIFRFLFHNIRFRFLLYKIRFRYLLYKSGLQVLALQDQIQVLALKSGSRYLHYKIIFRFLLYKIGLQVFFSRSVVSRVTCHLAFSSLPRWGYLDVLTSCVALGYILLLCYSCIHYTGNSLLHAYS